jgi:hypothetical protein
VRLRTRELVAKPPVRRVHYGACGRTQQELVLGWHQISAPEKDTARFIDPGLFGTAFNEPFELLVQSLQVARAMLVEHDEVERQAFQTQVLVGLQELHDQCQLGDICHAY